MKITKILYKACISLAAISQVTSGMSLFLKGTVREKCYPVFSHSFFTKPSDPILQEDCIRTVRYLAKNDKYPFCMDSWNSRTKKDWLKFFNSTPNFREEVNKNIFALLYGYDAYNMEHYACANPADFNIDALNTTKLESRKSSLFFNFWPSICTPSTYCVLSSMVSLAKMASTASGKYFLLPHFGLIKSPTIDLNASQYSLLSNFESITSPVTKITSGQDSLLPNFGPSTYCILSSMISLATYVLPNR